MSNSFLVGYVSSPLNSIMLDKGVVGYHSDKIGAVQKRRHRGRGKGSDRLVTDVDKGEEILASGDVTIKKYFNLDISF